MARPRKTEKRDQQLNLKLTVREIEMVRDRARAAGVRPVVYGRAQLLAERLLIEGRGVPQIDPLLLAQLSRLGNNLNQMTRRFHQTEMPPPPALESLLNAIRKLIERATADGS